MGVVPKERLNPVIYRVLHDLSWPRGHSISDFISAERFRCTHDTLDRAMSLVKQANQGALMAKLDLSPGCLLAYFSLPGVTVGFSLCGVRGTGELDLNL